MIQMEQDNILSAGSSLGRNQLFISGGQFFMNFRSMISSCLFKRGTTFSQTITKFSSQHS